MAQHFNQGFAQRDHDGYRTKHIQGHVWKAPKNGNVVWYSTYGPDTQEAGGISWVSFEIYGILGVGGRIKKNNHSFMRAADFFFS